MIPIDLKKYVILDYPPALLNKLADSLIAKAKRDGVVIALGNLCSKVLDKLTDEVLDHVSDSQSD